MKTLSIKRSALAGAVIAALSMVGCNDKVTPPIKANMTPATAADIDPRSKVVGVEAGGPATETLATTSTAKTDIDKAQQSSAMPMPGQANDHSTLAPKPSQKSDATGR